MPDDPALPGFTFINSLGIDGWEAAGDVCRAHIIISEKHHNPVGICHGGVLFSLVDTVMGMAVRMAIQPTQRPSTTDIAIRYFRPVVAGRVTAAARIVHLGRTTAAILCELTNDDGKMVGLATGNFQILGGAGSENASRAEPATSA